MVKVALAQEAGEEPQEPRPRRRRRPLLRLTMLLLVVIAAAPSALTYSGQAQTLLSRWKPELGAAISFQSLQLHWWAPVEVRSLKVLDLSTADGEATTERVSEAILFQADVVATSQPLWKLVLERAREVRIRLTAPVAYLATRGETTNVQQTLERLTGPASEGGGDTFPFVLTIENGTIHCAVETAESGSGQVAKSIPLSAVIEKIQGEVSTVHAESRLPAIQLSASVRSSGEVAVPDQRRPRSRRLTADLEETMRDFPSLPLTELTGETAENAGDATLLRITLNPEVDSLGRQLVQIGSKNLDLQMLQPFLLLAGMSVQTRGVLSGGIDARIAGPNPLDGIAGRILLNGHGVELRDTSWSAGEWLRLGNVQASGAAALAEDGLLIDELSLASDVVTLNGQGELRLQGEDAQAGAKHAELTCVVSLPRLAADLRQTLALHPDVKVEKGELTLGLSLHGASETGAAAGETPGQTSDLISNRGRSELAVPGDSGTWKVTATTTGLRILRNNTVLNTDAGLQAEAFGRLVKRTPVLSHAVFKAAFGTLECAPDGEGWHLAGTLDPEQFWQQVRQLTDLPQPGLRSTVTFETGLVLKERSLLLTDAVVESAELQLSSPAMTIDPSAPLTQMFDGTASLQGTAGAFRMLVAPWHDAWWISERSRVQCRLAAAPSQDIDLLVKILPGTVAAIPRPVVRQASTTRRRPVIYTGSLVAENAFVVDEAEMQLSLAARNSGEEFDVRKGFVRLPGVLADLTGVVAIDGGELNVSLNAATDYDLQALSQRVFIPESGVYFEGRGKTNFTLKGFPAVYAEETYPPANRPPRFVGSGTLAWTAGAFQGLQIGPAELSLELQDYMLRSGPIRCQINGGEASLVPQYDIARSLLALGTGSRVENLQLTQEFCGAWLGYVSPLLAASLDVQGTLSARVEQFLWDFEQVGNSAVAGQLTIHQAHAAPGGSLTVLLEVFDLIRRKSGESGAVAERRLLLPEQTVAVRVAQGFVAHEGLQMELAGYRLSSSGAVGFNQQLQLVLDVPLEKNTGGRGATIRVPLRGTVKQPMPDTAAMLQALGTQQLQNQLGDKLDQTINRQLDNLLKKF
jgi:hypothetical protein